MDKIRNYVLKKWFLILAITIVLITVFLRFYNYENRWGLAHDQAYSALLARYAIESGKIPLVGPFSSVGPFQTGGEWYWFVMLGTLLNPNSVVSPWVLLSISSTLFVVAMIFFGKELENRIFGLLVGFLAAVSTSQMAQSFNLTNQSIIGIFSLFSIWSAIRYIRLKKQKYLFFLGLNISLAATIHLQGAALLALIPVTIIFSGMLNIREFLFLFSGLFIPTIPILLFDLKNNFVNTKNMIDYYLYGQYKISLDVLGRRWLTYISSFWPNSWAHVIGGNLITGNFIFFGLFIIFIYNLLNRKITKEWAVILLSFIIMFGYLRYLRTPLFDSYLIFLHPFILLLTGWLILGLYKKKAFFGIVVFVVILMGSFSKDIREISFSGNYAAIEGTRRVKTLSEKFPNEKFSVYSYKYKWTDKNLALSLFLSAENKIDENGRKIGIVVATKEAEFDYSIIEGGKVGYQLIDLSSSTSGQLSESRWVRVNPEDIYQATQEWYYKQSL